MDDQARVAGPGELWRVGGILPQAVLPQPFAPALCAAGPAPRLLLVPRAREAIHTAR